ncbi:hypothetical protein R5R35_008163 [Gryllus longicercus]|uniref:Uncharacterized protein n=1 Tax=Gryllus longicercus TaxID=2509291 RepID=A0AAN9VWH8_9ORTH
MLFSVFLQVIFFFHLTIVNIVNSETKLYQTVFLQKRN